jgi:hypothetical protein
VVVEVGKEASPSRRGGKEVGAWEGTERATPSWLRNCRRGRALSAILDHAKLRDGEAIH